MHELRVATLFCFFVVPRRNLLWKGDIGLLVPFVRQSVPPPHVMLTSSLLSVSDGGHLALCICSFYFFLVRDRERERDREPVHN